MTPTFSIGVDLGGTTIKAVAATEAGDVLGRRRVATDASEGREAVLGRVAGVIAQLLAEVPVPTAASAVRGVGVAVPGVLDAGSGRVEFTVALTPDWNGFAASTALEHLIKHPVSLMNDAQAATLGEQVWGGGKHYRDFVCITVGTGVGGGLVLDDRLYTGSRGMAGVIGHTTVLPDGPRCGCGNRGCLEVVASGAALARAAQAAIEAGDIDLARLTGTRTPAPEQVAQAAAANKRAREFFHQAGTYLGLGLANLVCILNPMAIVVGGGLSGAGELLLAPIRREIEARTSVFSSERGGVEVIQSPLAGEAGAIGSAAWAMRQ